MSLLPANTPLPASDRMTYLLARLETQTNGCMDEVIDKVSKGISTMNTEIGPAVGCLMATYGTNMINSCIFDFEDPVTLLGVDERIELWGLQIPHNSARPALEVRYPRFKYRNQDMPPSTAFRPRKPSSLSCAHDVALHENILVVQKVPDVCAYT